jgi:nitrate/nitrite transporter NarK
MTFTPTLLTVNGIAIEWANIISAIMVISGVFGGILIGITSDKWGESKTILRLMAMICILSLILFQVQSRIVLITIICVLGFLLLGFPSAYYALISIKIEFKNLTAVYGILLSIAWGIGGLFPYIAGVIADSYGIHSIFILLVVSSIASMTITYFKFKT